MERTLQHRRRAGGRADRDARRARRRRAHAARAGVGRPRRAGRSCSSTAGRSASCAGRGRSPARSPSDFRIVTFDLRGHGMSEKPLDAEHYLDARLWADDLARGDRAGWRSSGRCSSRGPTAASSSTDYLRAYGEAAIAGVDLVGGAVLLHADASTTSARGCSRTPATRCGPDLPTNIAAIRRFLRACTARPLERRRLEHGAVLEHGRAARGARGAARARDRRRRRPLPAVRPGAGHARPRRRDRPALDGRARARASARRRGPPGTRASATCRSSRTPAGSTASSPSSSVRSRRSAASPSRAAPRPGPRRDRRAVAARARRQGSHRAAPARARRG